MFAKRCKTCQHSKNRKTIYGHLPYKNISELKLWDLVHLDLKGLYSKSIRQYHQFSAIIRKNVSMNCMTMIGLATGSFEIVDIPKFDLNEVMSGNYEYTNK